MSIRLLNRFLRERVRGRKLFVPFITAGDRGMGFTHRAILALEQAGADAVELGVPFSDPLADGPVIQRSSQRALAAGTTLAAIFEEVRKVRRKTAVPIVLMGYYNPVLQMGLQRAASAAAAAGVDGFVIPDLPPEEARDWIAACRAQDVDTMFLAAPTSTPERLAAVAQSCSGYVYYVSVTGITGVRRQVPANVSIGVEQLRRLTPLPILVGFGVSNPSQARALAEIADGVIVGSVLVRQMEAPVSNAQALAGLAGLAQRLGQAVKRAGAGKNDLLQ